MDATVAMFHPADALSRAQLVFWHHLDKTMLIIPHKHLISEIFMDLCSSSKVIIDILINALLNQPIGSVDAAIELNIGSHLGVSY